MEGAFLYEGKAKILYEAADPLEVRVVFKDEATAGNGRKRGIIAGKGEVNARVTAHLMRLLEQEGIPTHFLEQQGPTVLRCRRLTMVPVEVVVRRVVAGSLASRLGWPEGRELPRPVVELYWKNDSLGDPLVNEDHLSVLGVADPGTVDEMRSLALRVAAVLAPHLLERGLVLVDFKLEFGRDAAGRLRVGDEISPDTCRLWDAATGERLDKDRFRRDMPGVEEAYQEVLRRVVGAAGEEAGHAD